MTIIKVKGLRKPIILDNGFIKYEYTTKKGIYEIYNYYNSYLERYINQIWLSDNTSCTQLFEDELNKYSFIDKKEYNELIKTLDKIKLFRSDMILC